MKPTAANLARAARAWAQLERAVGPIGAAHTDANAERMMGLLDSLVEASRLSTAPKLAGLLAFVTEWVQAYDASTTPMPTADPVELLRHLMKENRLRQVDLGAELGGQSVVSAILHRRRQINAKQARALGQRFALSPAAFIAQAPSEASGIEPKIASTAGEVVPLEVRDAFGFAALTSEKVYELPVNIYH